MKQRVKSKQKHKGLIQDLNRSKHTLHYTIRHSRILPDYIRKTREPCPYNNWKILTLQKVRCMTAYIHICVIIKINRLVFKVKSTLLVHLH